MRYKAFLLATALATTPVFGQDIVSARAGLIHYTEGDVLVNNKLVEQTGDKFNSMKQGDTFSTKEGRAEILLNAGTYLRVGEASAFRLDSADLSDTHLSVLSGKMIVEVAELPKDTAVAVELLGSTVSLTKRGLYEFTADKPGNVRVYDGELALSAQDGLPIKITKGREIAFNALASGPGKFDTDDTSELYNWTAHRARYIAQVNEAAAQSTSTSSYNRSLLSSSLLGNYGGAWFYNPIYGMYTYLPLTGYGYSPFGMQIYSPVTIFYAMPVSYGTGINSASSAASSTAAARASVAPSSGSSVGSIGNSAPAAVAVSSAPAAAPSAGASAGHRR